ncbi:MAG TPA: hypothetical protein VGH15_06565 [Caulobacteraceae bacterium]|jgi:hypothetical protein
MAQSPPLAPLLAALVLAVAPAARAADLAAAAAPGVTWFDLMKQVIPDLAWAKDGAAVGHRIVPFSHIDGKDAVAEPQESFSFSSVDVLAIPGDPSRVIALADLGPSEGNVADANLLVLFALGRRPRVLDVVEVGVDRFVGFREGPTLMLAPHSPLILIVSEHVNSDESFDSTALIFIRHDRFAGIDSIFSYGMRTCAALHTQTPTFTTLNDPGPYRAIRVRVVDKVKLSGEDCGDDKPPKASLRIFQGMYRWNPRASAFVTGSRSLRRLAEEDAKIF